VGRVLESTVNAHQLPVLGAQILHLFIWMRMAEHLELGKFLKNLEKILVKPHLFGEFKHFIFTAHERASELIILGLDAAFVARLAAGMATRDKGRFPIH